MAREYLARSLASIRLSRASQAITVSSRDSVLWRLEFGVHEFLLINVGGASYLFSEF